MTDTTIRPGMTVVADPVNFCIYCGATGDLSEEHVIPYFLAGGLKLPKSSCAKCAKITASFEGTLANGMFLPMRRRMKVQSRSKGGRTDHTIITTENGVEVEKQVPFENLPPFVSWPTFALPGIMSNAQPSNEPLGLGIVTKRIPVRAEFVNGHFSVKIHPTLFLRLLAKIGLGLFYSLPDERREGWEAIIGPAIRFGHFLPFYVGMRFETGGHPPLERPAFGAEQSPLYRTWMQDVRVPGDNCYIYRVAIVELFSPASSPVYQIVTARKSIPGALLSPGAQAISLPLSPSTDFKGEPGLFHVKTTQDEANNQ